MASSVVLMVVVVKGVRALLPKALTGLEPDATMWSHQRVRGETQRQRVSAVGEFFVEGAEGGCAGVDGRELF